MTLRVESDDRIRILPKNCMMLMAELIDPENFNTSLPRESPDDLVHSVTESIWTGLDEQQLQQCSTAELDLIRHHIRSAIEEGIKRGQIQAEREIEIILNKYV